MARFTRHEGVTSRARRITAPYTDASTHKSGFYIPTTKRSAWARRSGAALENHVRVAHGGVFQETCPACVELRASVTE